MPFVSRGGDKLEHALDFFHLDVAGFACADLGSNAGGFVDCLLQKGAKKVYAVDTGYGALDWKLRTDARVMVMERTNAIHVQLPERVQLVTIDVAWTKQRIILAAAAGLLAPGGSVVTLIKPHYEAHAGELRGGVLPADKVDAVVERVRSEIVDLRYDILGITQSPIRGGKGNIEMLAHVRPLVTGVPKSHDR